MDAAALPVETAIKLLKARQPFTMPLAAALDEWADTYRGLTKDAAGAERLVAVARGIDPEPLRDKVRDKPHPKTVRKAKKPRAGISPPD